MKFQAMVDYEPIITIVIYLGLIRIRPSHFFRLSKSLFYFAEKKERVDYKSVSQQLFDTQGWLLNCPNAYIHLRLINCV